MCEPNLIPGVRDTTKGLCEVLKLDALGANPTRDSKSYARQIVASVQKASRRTTLTINDRGSSHSVAFGHAAMVPDELVANCQSAIA